MNKVTLILPYFGEKFPNFFSILLESMYKNDRVRFLVFTNIDVSNIDRKRKNVKFISTTLEKVQKRVSTILGYKAELTQAYKLCDYKPFYGLIFKKYLLDADWWGYFDSDIVFGNLNKFIECSLFNEYDRIFTHGHLTFYKNIEKVNKLCITQFKDPAFENYKKVTKSKLIYGFDEWGDKYHGKGLSAIIDSTDYIRQYDNITLFADILVENFVFVTTSNVHIKYFNYKRGKLFGIDDKHQYHEYLYAHFQKRKMINNVRDIDSEIYIFPNYMTNDYNQKIKGEEKRWKINDLKRRSKRFIKNLNIDNIKFCLKR